MTLAKHLSDQDVDKIIGILDGWQGKLTWDALCESASKHVGKRPTRQSLNAHIKIKTAFVDKKKRLKDESFEVKMPPSLAVAGQRIKRLVEENARLKSENDRLIEQYVIWQYNAYRHGLTKEKLNASLPAIDREISK